MSKSIKTVLIIIAFLLYLGVACTILTRIYFKTWNVSYSFNIVKNIIKENPEFYHIKKAYYCGSGGFSNCKHWLGFIYYDDDLTAEQAMEKAGFKDIGHTYTSYNGKTQTEYCTGECGDHSIIKRTTKFLGGNLLEYHVEGTG